MCSLFLLCSPNPFFPHRHTSKCKSFPNCYCLPLWYVNVLGQCAQGLARWGLLLCEWEPLLSDMLLCELWLICGSWAAASPAPVLSSEPEGAGGQQGYQWQAAPLSHYWEAWIAVGFSRDRWHGIFLGLRCSTAVRPVTPQCPLSLSSVSATMVHLEWGGYNDNLQLDSHTSKYTYSHITVRLRRDKVISLNYSHCKAQCLQTCAPTPKMILGAAFPQPVWLFAAESIFEDN